MRRIPWATLAVAGSLFLVAGCCWDGCCWGSRWPSCGCDPCCCGTEGAVSAVEGPLLAQPEVMMPTMPPPPLAAPMGPPTAPPPRIVPVPQANPMPYTPTGWRKWRRW